MNQQKYLPNARGLGLAAFFGLISVGILLFLGVTAPAAGCAGVDISPGMAFQAVKSIEDLRQIFGLTASDCQASLVAGLRTGSQIDLFLFIPTYAVFLALFVYVLPGRTKGATTFLFAALAITILGDIGETATQLLMLDNIDGSSGFITQLMAGNGIKIIGLSLYLLSAGFDLWQQPRLLTRAISVVLIILACARIAGYLIESIQQLAPLSALGAFVILWLYSSIELILRRKSARG